METDHIVWEVLEDDCLGEVVEEGNVTDEEKFSIFKVKF